MSNLKNRKDQEHTLKNRAHYVRPHVTSVKSSLFAEIDKTDKNKRQRTQKGPESIPSIDLLGVEEEELAPPPLDFKRNLSTQTQISETQSISSYASSYASSINIILHKEKDQKNSESRTIYKRIYTSPSIFNSPIEHTQPVAIKRGSSNKSEPFCHSIFQTPSPTKSASPEKLKTQRQSDHDMLPFTAPQRKKWDFLEEFRKMEKEEERIISSAGLNR